MRYAALLLLAAMVGCGSVEKKEDARPPVAADTPPPGQATAEIPDFGDPKPPIPAASKGSKEVESTREALLHGGGH